MELQNIYYHHTSTKTLKHRSIHETGINNISSREHHLDVFHLIYSQPVAPLLEVHSQIVN